jgi:quinol monooxygenase YgiN
MQMQIGRFAIDPELRDAFLEFARMLVEREQGAPGCLRFAIYEDVHAPNHFMMYEEWEDDALLEQHLENAHVQEDEQTLARFLIGEPSWDEFVF